MPHAIYININKKTIKWIILHILFLSIKNLSTIEIIEMDKTPIANFSYHKKFVTIIIYIDKQRIKVKI